MPYTRVTGIGCGDMNMVYRAFKISLLQTIYRIGRNLYKGQQALGTGV